MHHIFERVSSPRSRKTDYDADNSERCIHHGGACNQPSGKHQCDGFSPSPLEEPCNQDTPVEADTGDPDDREKHQFAVFLETCVCLAYFMHFFQPAGDPLRVIRKRIADLKNCQDNCQRNSGHNKENKPGVNLQSETDNDCERLENNNRLNKPEHRVDRYIQHD